MELDDIKTYPSEIIPGLLYLGNLRHGTEAYIKKDLKLGSYVDCTTDNADMTWVLIDFELFFAINNFQNCIKLDLEMKKQ